MQNITKNKSDLGKQAFKAGAWYTISNIAVKAIAVITTPIYTRLLSTYDYGVAATFISWYNLLLTVCSLDLSVSVGRAKQDFPGKLDEFIGALQTLSAVFSMALFVVAYIFVKPVSDAMEMNGALLFILAVYLFFSPAVIFAQTQYRYEYNYKGNIFILFYTTITNIIVSLSLIVAMQSEKYVGRILGTALPTILLGFVFWIICIKRKTLSFNRQYWKYALSIAAPMLLHTVSMNLMAQSDRVIITKMVSVEATGIYTLAYQYAVLINIIMNSVSQAWLPWFHDNYYMGNYELIRSKTKPLTVLACFIGVGCISLSPEAIRILGPSTYQEGVWVVPPVVVGILCQFLYSNYINIELHLKDTKYASYGTLIAAIVNIVLNIIFVPRFGFVAAAYTTLVSFLLLWIIHFVITRYILGVRLYDERFFIICLIVVCGLSMLFMALFDYFAVRFVLMCMIGIGFIIYNRKNIVKI